MPPTIVATRSRAHWNPKHWHGSHWAGKHFLISYEVIYSTAPKSCMVGTFNLDAAPIEGTFEITVAQEGTWSEC